MSNGFLTQFEEMAKKRKETIDKLIKEIDDSHVIMASKKSETEMLFVGVCKLVERNVEGAAKTLASLGSGDTIKLYTNKQAIKNIADANRLFIQVLFYPRTRGIAMVGHNTPSIVFEAEPQTGLLKVLERTSYQAAPLKEIASIDIGKADEKYIEARLASFFSQVMKVN